MAGRPVLRRWGASWQPNDSIVVAVAAIATASAGATHVWAGTTVAPFAAGAVALASVATVVGRSVRHLGSRWSPAATGVVQATVGNLPELLFGIFALRSGLATVVEASLIGSVLANTLLVLGIACLVGGLRHGTQRFAVDGARATAVLLLLATAVVAIPSTMAIGHSAGPSGIRMISVVAAVALLVAYGASLLAGLRHGATIRRGADGTAAQQIVAVAPGATTPPGPDLETQEEGSWPADLALGVLVVAALAAGAVSDWFVAGLRPALAGLGVSQTFIGVVVVAIAGNAVENVGGVAFAARNQMDHAIAGILGSPVQVLLGVFPVLVLVAPAFGASLSFAVPALLLVALGVAAVVTVAVVVDGASTWVEGVCLIGLYSVVAAAAFGFGH